ncbi:MAG TPA: hypothetical protein VLX68_11005 [Chitinivibrionales bacterium]|nr:hypothetical protein [Chitinivibrionales bacterium]
MNKVKLISLCAAILFMGMASNPVNVEKNASISIAVDSCLVIDGKNTVKIRLVNKSKNDYWINTWNIRVLLRHENGKMVEEADNKRAPEGPFDPQFELLKGTGSFEMIQEINFSDQYKISATAKYQIECNYENSMEQDNTKFKTLIGFARSNAVNVSFCR